MKLLPSVNQRIKDIVDKEFGGNVTAFAKKLGYDSSQKINRLFKIDPRSAEYPVPSSSILSDISNIFDISIDFLQTGKNTAVQSINPESEEECVFIYLLPVSAQAGKLNDFMTSVKEGDCEKIVTPIRDAEFAITITGESMSPEYPNGSRAFVKKIDENIFIEWGRDYVVDTSNGIVIKRLVSPERDGHLRCISINPDQKKYAPFDIPTSEVFGVYRILLCMSLK
ncbi:MAG: S24 family peptidase [Bacteroidales bacterium]